MCGDAVVVIAELEAIREGESTTVCWKCEAVWKGGTGADAYARVVEV